MKDSVLIAPLAAVVPSRVIQAALLRVISRDEFKFLRDTVSGNPAVVHNNVTEISMALLVDKNDKHIFDEIDPDAIIESEDEEEDEKPKGRRGRRATVVEPAMQLIEVDCGIIGEPVIRQVSIAGLTESVAYTRALEKYEDDEEKASMIEDYASKIENTVMRIATLQQRLQTGLAAPQATISSDLVPTVGVELEKLNQDAIARQEEQMQAEISKLRAGYDKMLTTFESKVFSKVGDEEEHPASAATFVTLGIDEYSEPKAIVALLRKNLVAL